MELIFETHRLIVRKFEMTDVRQLYVNHLEKEVKDWIPNESYADMEETRGAVEFYMDCVDQRHLPFVLAVESKETGELIGDTGINEVDGSPNEVEIGYSIARKYSGNGYATELVNQMSEFVHEQLGVNRLYGRVMHGNRASERVLEKNGFSFITEEFGAEDDPYGKGMRIYRKDY